MHVRTYVLYGTITPLCPRLAVWKAWRVVVCGGVIVHRVAGIALSVRLWAENIGSRVTVADIAPYYMALLNIYTACVVHASVRRCA
jgi:hypothetical protein